MLLLVIVLHLLELKLLGLELHLQLLDLLPRHLLWWHLLHLLGRLGVYCDVVVIVARVVAEVIVAHLDGAAGSRVSGATLLESLKLSGVRGLL